MWRRSLFLDDFQFPQSRTEPFRLWNGFRIEIEALPIGDRATILPMTRERWAQLGIMLQFLIIARTLGEIFRLRHVLGPAFSTAVAMQYVGGASIAACSCWAGVTFYFFRRYLLSAWIAVATVIVLLIYKVGVIGR